VRGWRGGGERGSAARRQPVACSVREPVGRREMMGRWGNMVEQRREGAGVYGKQVLDVEYELPRGAGAPDRILPCRDPSRERRLIYWIYTHADSLLEPQVWRSVEMLLFGLFPLSNANCIRDCSAVVRTNGSFRSSRLCIRLQRKPTVLSNPADLR
jgi:hypothetical protein